MRAVLFVPNNLHCNCLFSKEAKYMIKVGSTSPLEMVRQVAKEPIETNNHKSCLVHIVLAPIIDIQGGCLRFHLGRIIGTLKMPPVYTIDPSSCQSQFTGFNAVIG